MHTYTVLFRAPLNLTQAQIEETLTPQLISHKGIAALTPESTLSVTLQVAGEQALKQAVNQIKDLFAGLKPLLVRGDTAHWEKGTLSLK